VPGEYRAADVDMHHQSLGGVPGVHSHAAERQAFALDGVVEHVPHGVELGLAVAVGKKYTALPREALKLPAEAMKLPPAAAELPEQAS
jgi:hypothetical protein